MERVGLYHLQAKINALYIINPNKVLYNLN